MALGEWRTGGAAAVAAQIPGVSRRTVYRSAPVMDAREDLQWRRETPESEQQASRCRAEERIEPRGTGAPIRRTAEYRKQCAEERHERRGLPARSADKMRVQTPKTNHRMDQQR